jgi:hypothetical protein
MIVPSFGLDLRWFGGLVGVYAQRQFVAIFINFLVIVIRFIHGSLYGAGGKLQGAGCGVLAANLYLHEHTALGLNPMAQAGCNDFNKKTY